MDLLTYIFKGSYVNRKKDKYFIKNILSTFNRDEITGVGIKLNNNPWSFEVFIFITIDTNYLKREIFTEWIKRFGDKYSLHNIFIGDVSKGGNIATFEDAYTLSYFDELFIFLNLNLNHLLEIKYFLRYGLDCVLLLRRKIPNIKVLNIKFQQFSLVIHPWIKIR